MNNWDLKFFLTIAYSSTKKKYKYLGIKSIKTCTGSIESHRTLIKEIKEDLKKWSEIPF